ncbi:MAG: c-type cytochrome [Myxococcota bacterium]
MSRKRRNQARSVESIRFGGWFLLFAGLWTGVTAWVVVDEMVTRRPWVSIRAAFNEQAEARGVPDVPIQLEQVSNSELGIIDRCTTCHLGIDRPEFADAPQPHRTHPRLDELLGPHPPRTYGCTVCHQGQGMQTKGVAGTEFAHGLDDPYWEEPLLSGPFAESTCVTCHVVDHAAAVAPVFGRGRQLFEELRCTGCHQHRFAARPDERTPSEGPPLNWTRVKQSPEFLQAWLRSPREIRPQTRMPDSWPEPVGPDFGPLPEGHPALAEWRTSRREEAEAISAYLGSLAPRFELPSAPPGGDKGRGEVLYRNLGCTGCHDRLAQESGPSEQPSFLTGPELLRIGEKASRAWMYAWLENPKAMWPNARMPDFHLSESERLDLVAYLEGLRAPGAPAAAGTAADWPGDPDLIRRGEALVRRLGCYGCHEIPGFQRSGMAGPTLEGFGDKTPDLLDWGHVTPPDGVAPLPAWTRIKLSWPRAMDREGVGLVMPKNALSPEDETALTTFVLSDRRRAVPTAYRPTWSRQKVAVAKGEKLLSQLGCRGCHEIGRVEVPHHDEDGALMWTDIHPRGGAIRALYEGVHLAPPSLTFAGMKLRYPWAFEYLLEPTTIRPWLPGPMPQFGLAPEQAETLVGYFAAADAQPFPFRSREVVELEDGDLDDAIWLFREMQCLKCHPSEGFEGDPAQLAPDLAYAFRRLSPEWMRQWFLDPQGLQPGTQMPTYFPLLDDDDPTSYTTPYPERLDGDVLRQVEALVALTLAYGWDSDIRERLRSDTEGGNR